MQVSDVILTKVSKCMASSAIGDSGETIEASFMLINVSRKDEGFATLQI